jgi:two-component system, NtrC family, nitrogen regulation response regulator GlnG
MTPSPLIADDGKPATLEQDVQTHLAQYFAAHSEGLPPPGLYGRILPLIEKPLIEMTLKATGGNQVKAAFILGINRNTLRKKMVALKIKVTAGGGQ